MPGKAPRDEAHVPARLGKLESHARRHLVEPGQMPTRLEGIVARVDDERRHADVPEHRLGARALVVVRGIAEAVQRGSDDIVELPQRASRAHPLHVEDAGMSHGFGNDLWLECAQEHARVDPRKAALDRVCTDGEIQRRRHRYRGPHYGARFGPAFAEPLEQRVAAERDARGKHRRTARLTNETRQQPVDLLPVAGVIRAR